MGDKWETDKESRGPQSTQSGKQAGDKCKFMRPRAPRVEDKSGKQVGDKCKTNVKACERFCLFVSPWFRAPPPPADQLKGHTFAD